MGTSLLNANLTRSILGAFFEVYNYFCYGLAEPVYAGGLELVS
jgi:hypothetical protein